MRAKQIQPSDRVIEEPVTVHTDTEPEVPIHVAAEAATWIARLHGPQRCRRMERECLQWQSRSEAHRFAFERCTATWEEVRGTSLSSSYDTVAGSHTTIAALLSKWSKANR